MPNILPDSRYVCWSTSAPPWTKRSRAGQREPERKNLPCAPPLPRRKVPVAENTADHARSTAMSNRPTVLILASDPAFSRELTEAWPVRNEKPEFVLLEEERCRQLPRDTYDLAVAHAISPEKHAILTEALRASRNPSILIH